MYENSGNNSNNGKMAIEKNQFIKYMYKPISGRLKEVCVAGYLTIFERKNAFRLLTAL